MVTLRNLAFVSLAVMASIVSFWGVSFAAPVVVDCAAGDSVTAALAVANDIVIQGECVENVEVAKDDVTLTGDTVVKGSIRGEVVVLSAQRVIIKNLLIRGIADGYGQAATRGASVYMWNSRVIPTALGNIKTGVTAARNTTITLDGVIVGGAQIGIDAWASSFIEITNGSLVTRNTDTGARAGFGSVLSILNSSVTDNTSEGISVHQSSSVDISDSTVTGNEYAVALSANSYARIANSIVNSSADGAIAITVSKAGDLRLNGGNVITATGIGGYAIDAIHGSTVWQQPDNGIDTITGPVQIGRSSIMDLQGTSLNGNVSVSRDGGLTIRNRTGVAGHTMISGNIDLDRDSFLSFSLGSRDDTMTIDGSINCYDTESSLSGAENHTITGTVNCTGF